MLTLLPGRFAADVLGMIYGATTRLAWDDLDAQGCAEDGTPDWSSLIVVGPMKKRDERGNVSLEWKVTVQCRPRP